MQQEPGMTKREIRRMKSQAKQERREAAMKKKKQRRTVTWSVGIAVVVLIILGLSFTDSADGPTLDSEANPQIVTSQDHVKGNRDTYVTLVEYSDFQCPACRTYYPVLKQLNEAFPTDLQIVYRHFPLVQIHPFAARAARAAEAAGMQGKFWEMHDAIFDTQSEWSKGGSPKQFFIDLAAQLELDVEQFEEDMDSDEAEDKVARDRNLGTKSGVTGTPSFFLNGRKIANPGSFSEFSALIQEAIDNTPTIDPATGEVTGGLEVSGEMFEVDGMELGDIQLEPGDEETASPEDVMDLPEGDAMTDESTSHENTMTQ